MDRLDTIGDSASLKVKRRRQQILVAVPAGDAERRTGRNDARPNHIAIINSIPQRDVRVVVGTQVTHGGEARFQCAPCVPRAVQRFARRRNPES